jgi:hypothetical protein
MGTLRPEPMPAVDVEDVDNELCLYRADIDEVLVLNSSAADVWRLSDGSCTVAEIVQLLARSYRTTASAILSDIDAVLVDLIERGFLRWRIEPDDGVSRS